LQRAGTAVRIHRDAEDQTGEERVDVHGSIRQERNPIDAGQLLIRGHPQVELFRAGLQAMNAVRE
jgi:hypothetical protein